MKPIIVIALAIFCAAVVGAELFMPRAEQPKSLITAPPKHMQQRIVELNHEAVEAAYRQQVYALFLGWMKDPTGQPERARLGVERATRAYIQSKEAIEHERRRWEER